MHGHHSLTIMYPKQLLLLLLLSLRWGSLPLSSLSLSRTSPVNVCCVNNNQVIKLKARTACTVINLIHDMRKIHVPFSGLIGVFLVISTCVLYTFPSRARLFDISRWRRDLSPNDPIIHSAKHDPRDDLCLISRGAAWWD